MSIGGGPPGSPLATTNYIFTDSELQSLLTSLDEGANADELLDSGPGSQSLQFLPHLPGAALGSSEPAPGVFVPADLSLPQLDGTVLPLPLPPSALPECMLPAAQLQPAGHAVQGDQHEQQHSRGQYKQGPPRQARPQGQRAGRAAAAPEPPAGEKPPHSLVEKQRRDRINCLIDEVGRRERAGG